MVKLTHTDSRQGAADRAAEGWQGEDVAMETGELGGGLQYYSGLSWMVTYLCDLSLEMVRTWTEEETYRGGAQPQRPNSILTLWRLCSILEGMFLWVRAVIVRSAISCIRNRRGGEIFTFIRKILPNIESSVDDSLPASKEG